MATIKVIISMTLQDEKVVLSDGTKLCNGPIPEISLIEKTIKDFVGDFDIRHMRYHFGGYCTYINVFNDNNERVWTFGGVNYQTEKGIKEGSREEEIALLDPNSIEKHFIIRFENLEITDFELIERGGKWKRKNLR